MDHTTEPSPLLLLDRADNESRSLLCPLVLPPSVFCYSLSLDMSIFTFSNKTSVSAPAAASSQSHSDQMVL